MNAASPALGSTIGKEKEANPSIRSFEIGGTTMCSGMLTVHLESTGASLVQGGCCEICPPVHEKYEAQSNPLHMNWVPIADTKGNHRSQMKWVVDL
jgi:hypothetical protein